MIREFRQSDGPALRRLHAAQGFDYEFPDLTQPQFVQILVAVDDEDEPVQALIARKTVELYFVGDPNWRTPRWRLNFLLSLGYVMHKALARMGFTDVFAALPPEIEKTFGKRLRRSLGWVESRWKQYVRYL